jgi:hypothetical protein
MLALRQRPRCSPEQRTPHVNDDEGHHRAPIHGNLRRWNGPFKSEKEPEVVCKSGHYTVQPARDNAVAQEPTTANAMTRVSTLLRKSGQGLWAPSVESRAGTCVLGIT